MLYLSPDPDSNDVDVALTAIKSQTSVGNGNYADADIVRALKAAARIVDDHTHRRFWADASADNVRYYTVRYGDHVEIWDDLIELTEMATDPTGMGTYSDIWAYPDDILLDPPNAPLDGAPWERIYVRRRVPTLAGPYSGYLGSGYACWGFGKFRWPYRRPQGLRITGKFGWPSVPDKVEEAVSILTPRFVKRAREATWGVIGLGTEGASPLRLTQSDPDVCGLLERLTRDQYFG